jgi:hypothetical protein
MDHVRPGAGHVPNGPDDMALDPNPGRVPAGIERLEARVSQGHGRLHPDHGPFAPGSPDAQLLIQYRLLHVPEHRVLEPGFVPEIVVNPHRARAPTRPCP